MENSDRSFTVIAIYKSGKKSKSNGGRYINKKPSSAAKKAFSQYYREHGKTGIFSLEIHIKETTQTSANKIFKYKVSKIKESKDVLRDGVMIHYDYNVKIKAL